MRAARALRAFPSLEVLNEKEKGAQFEIKIQCLQFR